MVGTERFLVEVIGEEHVLVERVLEQDDRAESVEAAELQVGDDGAWAQGGSWARRSRIPPFVTLRRRIVHHRAAIHATLDSGLSNALIESTNTKIRLLTRIAFGFHGPRTTHRPRHAQPRRPTHPSFPAAHDPRIRQEDLSSDVESSTAMWRRQSTSMRAATARLANEAHLAEGVTVASSAERR